MFEKEAKEYATDFEKEFHTSYGACLHTFQDAAEFGYKIGKAELEEITARLDKQKEINKEDVKRIVALEKANAALEKRIERAKSCMKKLMFIINSDPANYNCKGLIQDVEDFIHNRICNIRQLGEHCISETRCIMCDRT